MLEGMNLHKVAKNNEGLWICIMHRLAVYSYLWERFDAMKKLNKDLKIFI